MRRQWQRSQNWSTTSTGAGIDQYKYTYYADSNVTALNVVTNTSSGTVNTSLADNESQTYTYNQLNQLADFYGGSLQLQWGIDGLGNWDGLDVDETYNTPAAFDHNAQNQLEDGGGEGNGAYSNLGTLTYDANGNTTTDETGQTYIYDAWNRAVQITTATDTINYSYDALGRRITETDANAGTTTDLYYSNRDQVIEEQQSGTTTTQYVWTPFYVDQMIERDDTPVSGVLTQRLYVEQDMDYNVTSITNSSGGVVERYIYDPYGNLTVLNGDAVTLGNGAASSAYNWIYLHQGLRVDVASGMYDDRARIYDPLMGRFLQEDPAGYIDGPNMYQYEMSNPVDSVDPTGRQFWIINFATGEMTAYGIATVGSGSGPAWYNGWGSTLWSAIGGNGGSTAGQVWGGAWDGANQGAAAAFDGMDPFGNPWADSGYYDPNDPILEVSHGAGTAAGLAFGGAIGITLVGGAATTGVGILTGETGCFCAGTLVLTSNGLQPIETIQLGRRVPTSVDDRSGPSIDPDQYRMIRLSYVKDGQEILMSFLRPAKVADGLCAGDTMDIAVMGLAVRGRARVLGVEPCPPIEEGLGSVVTGAFNSESLDVLRLKLNGLDAPIEVTGNHPIFSEDRHDFVPANSLHEGERLRTRDGVAVVESIEKKYGGWTVYNLEVHGAHRYYVTEQQVLVHNDNGVTDSAQQQIDYLQSEIDETMTKIDNIQAGNNARGDGPYDTSGSEQYLAELTKALADLIAKGIK